VISASGRSIGIEVTMYQSGVTVTTGMGRRKVESYDEVLACFRIGHRRARRCDHHLRHQQHASLTLALALPLILGGAVVVAGLPGAPAVASCNGNNC
jgi:hypothetical protein